MKPIRVALLDDKIKSKPIVACRRHIHKLNIEAKFTNTKLAFPSWAIRHPATIQVGSVAKHCTLLPTSAVLKPKLFVGEDQGPGIRHAVGVARAVMVRRAPGCLIEAYCQRQRHLQRLWNVCHQVPLHLEPPAVV